MIKFHFIAPLVLLAFYSFAQAEIEEKFVHHCYFNEKSLTIGIGVPYSFHTETPGVNLRMYYNIGEKVCFGPEYGYIKNNDLEIVDFDFIGHYIFETNWVGIYPLVGANYTSEKELQGKKEVHTSFGIVFGAGIHRNFKNLTAFMEYSRVELGINDQFITGGLMFNFQ